MRASLSLHDLTLTWPDGTTVVDRVSADLGPGRHALVGANGSGKSTLLRLVAGDLSPTSGTVSTPGTLAYLPQDPLTGDERTVADVLGVSSVLAALRAVESGSTDIVHYETVGDDWDVEDRAGVVLGRLGLDRLTLDRTTDGLSGGELVMLSLGARLLGRPDVLLLDEPTNNLDGVARERLVEVVDGFRGLLLVASHDRQLLDHVDQVGEVRDGRVRWFSGTYDDYRAAVDAEQEAAERDVRDAEQDLRKQRRELAEAEVKLARRKRYGQKMSEQKREPKIVMGNRKRAAQESAARLRGQHQGDVSDARSRLEDAEGRLRDDREVRLDLPATEVPSSRVVLTMEGVRLAHVDTVVDLDVRGPERVAITGRNGSGKTTLLRTAVGLLAPVEGEVRLRVPARHLPQRLDLLDPSLSVVDNLRRAAPSMSETELRSALARLLFRARRADQPVGSLSGGERLRATLGCVLHAEPAPQLLLLDEPTNNLDLVSTAHLVEALAGYRGALLVVSHDDRFLDDLGLDRRFAIDHVDPPPPGAGTTG